MKEYPSIPFWNKGTFGERVYVFEKLDGTQLRIEWSKKQGFYKFGTRGQLINEEDRIWGNDLRVLHSSHLKIFLTILYLLSHMKYLLSLPNNRLNNRFSCVYRQDVS